MATEDSGCSLQGDGGICNPDVVRRAEREGIAAAAFVLQHLLQLIAADGDPVSPEDEYPGALRTVDRIFLDQNVAVSAAGAADL